MAGKVEATGQIGVLQFELSTGKGTMPTTGVPLCWAITCEVQIWGVSTALRITPAASHSEKNIRILICPLKFYSHKSPLTNLNNI